MKTAVVAGATGLIGKELVTQLATSNNYSDVIALVRRPVKSEYHNVTNLVTDLGNPGTALSGYRPDDVFCCLGTTMAKAGSKENFYQVDFTYPVLLAQATLALGAKQYLLVTALGADRTSAIYYNRVKGEVEDAIRAMRFRTLHILRPSLLLGPREEKRAGEDAAKLLYRVFGFILPEKYKAIEASTVARAMVEYARHEEPGSFIHESKEMQTFR